MRTPPEVIVTPSREGELFCWNPFVRVHLLGDPAFVELLAALAGDRTGDGGDALASLRSRSFRVRDASAPPFADGLLGDPTGRDRDATLEGVEPVDLDGALELARRGWLVVDDEAAYAEFLTGRRLGPIDRAHRGTIHQQAGEYALLRARASSVDDWWVDQKFTEDRREPRPGPYLDVQWRFATSHWTRERLAGKRVLDFGCGPGLFARLFASAGASVLGVDISEDHLETAARLAAGDGLSDSTEFRVLDLPPERTLEALGEKFDVILLSDVLMFYFHPYDLELDLDPAALLESLSGVLAGGGTVEVLEPNGLFWQQPRMGSHERPLTVLSEYRNRRLGVTPTLEEMSRAAESAGLAISSIRELTGDSGYPAEFPLWWYFEMRKVAA